METPSRRRILSVLGTGLTAGLAGCNTSQTNPTTASPEPDATAETTTTTEPPPELSVQLTTERQPSQLPAIWTDHDITAYQAQLAVETTGGPDTVTIATETASIDQLADQWQGSTVTVYPYQLGVGTQTVTATASKTTAQAKATAEVTKALPTNYKLDIVPRRNESLRETITEDSDEEEYLQQRGGFVTDDPVFDTYSSHNDLDFDKVGIDLPAYEWHHDNNYEELAATRDSDMSAFIESLGRETGINTIEEIKTGQRAPSAFYPNGNPDQYEAGSFEYQSFREAETLGEALDWVFPYYFNWQSVMTDVGPYSTEDLIYATTLEQAIEQKGNEDLEVHAWDVELGGGHGNGLIYGENADGSEELRVMETVASPVTATADDIQHFPLVEESGYLNPENDGFSKYWHPLRFGWGDKGPSDTYPFGFEGRKQKATRTIVEIANTINDSWSLEWIAPTTEYAVDFTEKLRTFNTNDAEFQTLYNQAKVMDNLSKDTESYHVIYGDTDNPQYAEVFGFALLEELWNDAPGNLDDFDQYLTENATTRVDPSG
jgi:hypothetical protein